MGGASTCIQTWWWLLGNVMVLCIYRYVDLHSHICAVWLHCIMKGTKVQTLGGRAVAGAWCMAGCLGVRAPGHGCNY